MHFSTLYVSKCFLFFNFLSQFFSDLINAFRSPIFAIKITNVYHYKSQNGDFPDPRNSFLNTLHLAMKSTANILVFFFFSFCTPPSDKYCHTLPFLLSYSAVKKPKVCGLQQLISFMFCISGENDCGYAPLVFSVQNFIQRSSTPLRVPFWDPGKGQEGWKKHANSLKMFASNWHMLSILTFHWLRQVMWLSLTKWSSPCKLGK